MSCNFPTASESKSISELRALHTEICEIETAILDAREAELRSTTICDTPMTTSVDHWDAWQAFQEKCGTAGLVTEHKYLLSLQVQVIACFQNLGYTIKRVTNPATGNTFCWSVNW